MIKNSKTKNLENIILSVVEKNNSDLDLSFIDIGMKNSLKILKKAVDETNNLILMGFKNPSELINTPNPKTEIKIINRNNLNCENIKNLDRTKVINSENYDLYTNPDFINTYLSAHPTNDLSEYKILQSAIEDQRKNNPLILDNSVDTVILDTDINSLELSNVKTTLLESFRVLQKGGKIFIRMILSDEPCNDLLPISLKSQELNTIPVDKDIISLLDQAGFHGMKLEWMSDLPIKIVKGIELKEFIISAYKGKQGPCIDCGQAVIYRGPWKEVIDDDGHHFQRGNRVAVCSKTYGVVNRKPYEGEFIYVPCYIDIPEESARIFDCNTPKIRDIRITKGTMDINESYQEVACTTTSCDCGCDC